MRCKNDKILSAIERFLSVVVMKNLINMIQKFINKVKRDGLLNALKKAFVKLYYGYLIKFSLIDIIKFRNNKGTIIDEFDALLNGDFDRIIIWRSSIGWSIPLFQRPQQLALELARNKTLVFFEVTRLTDKIDFISKKENNLYLVDFSCKEFSCFFHEMLNNVDKPKYLFTASTCWDLSDKEVMNYISKGYKFLYDYLDELSPELAGTSKIPFNVETIHNYVINNPEDTFVICTADTLLKDIIKKRNNDKRNIIYVSNGVDYNHFTKLEKDFTYSKEFKRILDNKKPIIGYYGALASWFDYDLVRYIADNRKDCNIVLIGAKYDTSFDKEDLLKYKNIHYLGPINYNDLPYYASKFNVCMLPFKINEITKSTNPIKVFEYMALSKPIVSTDLNECRKYKPILIGKTHEQFLQKLELSLEGLGKDYKKNEKEIALNNTWNSKVKDIIKSLERFEKKYPYLSPKSITMARILYKLYSKSNKYNVNNQIQKTLDEKNKLFIITMNSETCIYAMKDEQYQKIVMDDEILLVPDSISISYAIKKVFGKSLKRYPGIEVLSYILEQLNEKSGSLYLFGSTKKVNKDMVHVIKKDYKNIKVIGSCDGYVEDYERVKDEIVSLKPDLVVVALGVPNQELFISDIYKRLNKGMFIGVGGSLDVLSGNKKRAPLFMRKTNLEWLYRILKDPKRIRRFYNNNIKFVNDIRKGN